MTYQNGAPCSICGQLIHWGQQHYCSRTAVPPYFQPVWSNPCDHCFCIVPNEHGWFEDGTPCNGVGPHRQCCKCKTVMAEEFIASPAPREVGE